MIKAVIFDMDGLLVDSETLAMRTVLKVAPELGVELEPGEEKNIVGRTARKFFTELLEKNVSTVNPIEAVDVFHHSYEKLLSTELEAFEGAKTLPKELKDQGFRLALVSGSTTTQVNTILNFLGVKDLFEVIVSVDDITHSKPNPEGFLLGAQKLGVDPEECVVLEDATAGVRAGKAAGMRVIGVRNNGDQDLSEADEVVNNLTEVKI